MRRMEGLLFEVDAREAKSRITRTVYLIVEDAQNENDDVDDESERDTPISGNVLALIRDEVVLCFDRKQRPVRHLCSSTLSFFVSVCSAPSSLLFLLGAKSKSDSVQPPKKKKKRRLANAPASTNHQKQRKKKEQRRWQRRWRTL